MGWNPACSNPSPHATFQSIRNRNASAASLSLSPSSSLSTNTVAITSPGIDGRPRRTIRQWRGEPRGRWEGSTLVVETLNFSDKSSFRGSDENLRLVERFTRVDQNTIEYQFTVEDPTVWTRPWTVVVPMRATTVEVFEFACHEGNARSLEGILSAARAAKR